MIAATKGTASRISRCHLWPPTDGQCQQHALHNATEAVQAFAITPHLVWLCVRHRLCRFRCRLRLLLRVQEPPWRLSQEEGRTMCVSGIAILSP